MNFLCNIQKTKMIFISITAIISHTIHLTVVLVCVEIQIEFHSRKANKFSSGLFSLTATVENVERRR